MIVQGFEKRSARDAEGRSAARKRKGMSCEGEERKALAK